MAGGLGVCSPAPALQPSLGPALLRVVYKRSSNPHRYWARTELILSRTRGPDRATRECRGRDSHGTAARWADSETCLLWWGRHLQAPRGALGAPPGLNPPLRWSCQRTEEPPNSPLGPDTSRRRSPERPRGLSLGLRPVPCELGGPAGQARPEPRRPVGRPATYTSIMVRLSACSPQPRVVKSR